MTSTDTDRADLVLAVLRELARESRLPEPAGGLTLDTRLETDLGLDSLCRSELLCRVERALGIALPDEALLAATGRALLQLAPLPGGVGARKAAQGAGTPEVAAAQGAPDTADTLLDALDWHLERHPERVHIFLYGPDDRARAHRLRGTGTGRRTRREPFEAGGDRPGRHRGPDATHRAGVFLRVRRDTRRGRHPGPHLPPSPPGPDRGAPAPARPDPRQRPHRLPDHRAPGTSRRQIAARPGRLPARCAHTGGPGARDPHRRPRPPRPPGHRHAPVHIGQHRGPQRVWSSRTPTCWPISGPWGPPSGCARTTVS